LLGAEQRRSREEKRKGLAVALSSRGCRHLGLARRAAVGVFVLLVAARSEKRGKAEWG
jgi:hypothetical protein